MATGSAQHFETKRVSINPSPLSQGETEISADATGNVNVVWMDGSPRAQADVTLRTTYSGDGGTTFASDRTVAGSLLLMDPALGYDQQGVGYLAALRQDDPFRSDDLAVILFRSSDHGRTWSAPVEVNDDHVFNDRPWITTDALGLVHLVYGRRVPLPDGNYDRPVYYRTFDYERNSFSPEVLINPPATRPARSAGGSPRGIVVTVDGTIIVGYHEVVMFGLIRAG